MDLDWKLVEVVSYKTAWDNNKSKLTKLIPEILAGVNAYMRLINDTFEGNRMRELKIRNEEMSRLLLEKNWSHILEQSGWRDDINPNLWSLGPSKLDCFVLTPIDDISILSWVFNSIKNQGEDFKKLPIALAFDKSGIHGALPRTMGTTALRNSAPLIEQLEELSPLLLDTPFVILCFGLNKRSKSYIHEILSYPRKKYLTEKSITFPPELYEAGRGILSYFGTYLEEQYGDQKAKVTIEQDDANKTLRMTVVSETGDKEVIEKAYEEYRLIVSKQAPPEQFTDNEKLILKLNNRIDILELEVKQEMRLRMVAEGNAEKYFKALNKSLNQKNETTVHVHQETTNQTEAKAAATAKATANAEAHTNISMAIGGVGELKGLVPADCAEARELEQLQDELEAIENSDEKTVKRSPAMSKLQRILDDVASGEGKLAKAVRAAENGYHIFKKVAKTYNKIAPWCGLPPVPGVLVD